MQLTASEDLREQLSAKTVTRRWRGIVSEGMALRQGYAHSCSSHAMLAENLMQRMQTCVSVPSGDCCLLLSRAHARSPCRSRSVSRADRRCSEGSSSSPSCLVPCSTMSPFNLLKSQTDARERTGACRRPRALSRAWPRCQGRSCRPPAVREHHRWSASSARPGTAPQRPRHIGSSWALPTEDKQAAVVQWFASVCCMCG